MDPLLYITIVLALGITAQWLAWKLGQPSIILLLLFGFAAGRILGGPGAILGDDLLFSMVSLAVALILFEGGLTLKIRELREAGAAVLGLCTIGVVVSWVTITLAARYIVGLDWRIASLLGAILVVTGPTVIAPILRTVKPNRRVSSIAKWEGIVIDPIGATLALLVFQGVSASTLSTATTEIVKSIGLTLLIGGGLGFIAGRTVEYLLYRHLIPDFLHSAFLLVITAAVFTASNAIQKESGLLTVTVLGFVLANQKSVSVRHIIAFKENLRVLLISTLFIVLSGRVAPEDVTALGWGAVGFLVFVIAVARPLGVYASTLRTRLTPKERLFLALLAPRGIVAAAITSIFALELHHAARANPGLDAIAVQADSMVPLVFAVIIGTVGFCGLVAGPVARRLGLAHRDAQGILFAGADAWARDLAKTLEVEGVPVVLIDTNHDNVSKARLSGLRAHRGSILAEFIEDELDLVGIGRLLAMTPNDEVNALAALEFSESFGRANVYQLRPDTDNGIERDKPAHHLRGRFPFQGQPTHERIGELVRSGYTLKKTELSEIFTIDHFFERHGQDAVILFVGREGKMLFYTDDDPPALEAGDKLIALVLETEKPAAAKKRQTEATSD